MRPVLTVPAVVVCAGFAGVASGQTLSTQRAVVDAKGFRIVSAQRPAPSLAPADVFQPVGLGIVWQYNDPISITNSVCVSDTSNETWLGHNLNNKRFSTHETDGDGTELWNFPIDVHPAFGAIATASAENVSLGLALAGGRNPQGTPAAVFAFTRASGNVPIWTFTFPASFNTADYRGIDVSADGTIVAAIGRDSVNNKSRLVILDGATGAELRNVQFDLFIGAVELSEDGSRAVLTQGDTARVIRTDTLETIHSFSVVGTGGYHRISRDGSTVAAGGFNFIAYKEIAGVWTQLVNRNEPDHWTGNGIVTDPSAFWYISRIGIRIRGDAHTVLFNE